MGAGGRGRGGEGGEGGRRERVMGGKEKERMGKGGGLGGDWRGQGKWRREGGKCVGEGQ